jgi:addiction module RelE/StbE family toxin
MEKITWSPSALDDLKNVYEYICNDSIFYADRVVEQIFHRVTMLEMHPNIGRMVPEKSDPNIREIIEGNYRIMYEIRNGIIVIYRIIHSSQLFKRD